MPAPIKTGNFSYRIKGWVYAPDGKRDSFFVKVNGSPTNGYAWHVLLNATYAQDYVREGCECTPFIHIRRPVKGDQAVVALFDTKLCHCVFTLDPGSHHFQRIDHYVADPFDLFHRNSFSKKVFIPVNRWRPEDVGNGIRHDAVDFFGHGSVE